MTPQQDQIVRNVEKEMEGLEDTCLRPEELQAVEYVREAVDRLKTVLNERE